MTNECVVRVWVIGALLSLVLVLETLAAEGSSTNSQSASNSVVVPFEFRRDHIMVRVKVDQSEPLLFMLDSGYGMNMISPEQATALGLNRRGKITIVGVAGEEAADMFEGPRFDFGNGFTYASRRVAALPSHSRQRTRRDGILGSGFYRRFVIEVDHRANLMTLREPKDFQYTGSGEVVALRFPKSTPVVRASIVIPDQPPIDAEFEIDTGCDGGLCLGKDFVDANCLRENIVTDGKGARRGVGGGAQTEVARLPQLRIGKLVIEKPTANFFEEGSPVDKGLAGHIGLEILRQFRVIFDYSRKQMILESYESPKLRQD
jgi:hypothetical protein